MAYVLHTSQLRVRRAEPADAEFIRSLWSSPRVMCFVGFPKGLATTANEIEKQIEGNSASELGVLLIAETLKSNVRVGQCKIGAPDEEGICEPDIKLKPEHWGDSCGKELWAAMIDYAFTHSPAEIVQGTPNRANTASVHMQQVIALPLPPLVATSSTLPVLAVEPVIKTRDPALATASSEIATACALTSVARVMFRASAAPA